MKDILTRFTRNLAIVSTVVAIAGLAWHFVFPELSTPTLPWLVLLFILTTFILYYILLKASTRKFSQFANYFMTASMVKLLMLLVIITVYVYFNRSDAIRFVITLFVLYLIYTVFEVSWLLKINKSK